MSTPSPERAHPYIPNSGPGIRADMLRAIGVDSVEALYASVPKELRLRAPLDLPAPILDEVALRRHVGGLLDRNTHTGEVLSFLGGGSSGGHVPAVVDEIVNRAEFVTSYGGGPYADLGKYQAIFEFQSLLGELLRTDVVSAPMYDGVSATSSALLMATRLTGRRRVLVPETINPALRDHLATFARRSTIEIVPADRSSGLLDLAALRTSLGPDVGAVLIENPSYLGFVEERAQEIGQVAHDAGALFVAAVDPSTLGVLEAPADYRVDIVAGDAQALGVHSLFGGGQVGFIAHRDDPDYVRENPSILISAVPTRDGTATGFAWSLMSSTSYDLRGEAQDYTGTSQWLWGIAVAVHLSLLGPVGIRELGEGLAARTAYLARRLASVRGIELPFGGRAHLRDVVVRFDGTGGTVAEVNRALLARGIFGGRDLSSDHSWLGQAALYGLNDTIGAAEIDRLADALTEILG
jgi:glycine dehydrogenase subunit 1